MPIVVNVDVMLARRKMRLNELAERVGITPQNLSVLKTGRARAIRFSTLEKLCEVLAVPTRRFVRVRRAGVTAAGESDEPGAAVQLALSAARSSAKARMRGLAPSSVSSILP